MASFYYILIVLCSVVALKQDQKFFAIENNMNIKFYEYMNFHVFTIISSPKRVYIELTE